MLRNTLSGILLIGGTCIGAGTLALPLSGAGAGLIPTLSFLLVCWLFMTLSALYWLEAALHFPPKANLITMVKETLGPAIQGITWLLYLLLFYALMTAYLDGSNQMLQVMWQHIPGVPPFVWQIALLAAFAWIIHAGTRTASLINALFMLVLLICFVAVLTHTHHALSWAHLNEGPQRFDAALLPVLLGSLGFHIVIPNLRGDLQCERQMQRVLLIGSMLPLLLYSLWTLWLFALFSAAQLTHLSQATDAASSLVHHLSMVAPGQHMALISSTFTLTLIITSFIGVSLSLYAFLQDGLNFHHNRRQRFKALCLTFLPPALTWCLMPASFLMAFRFAGLIVALLLGVWPTWLVWRLRRCTPHHNRYRVPGGALLLGITWSFFAGVVVLEVLRLFGHPVAG